MSWARAAQDGVWVVSDTESATPSAEPSYSYDFISSLEGLLIEGDNGWPELCAELGVTPCEITYEDLVDPANYVEVIRSALTYLGIEDNDLTIPQPRTHRQADEINDDWVRRYRADRPNVARCTDDRG